MDFQTPKWICELMVSRVEGRADKILEPTSGEGKLVDVITLRYPKAEVLRPPSFLDFGIVKVNWVISNPPFTPMKLGYTMLERFFDFSGNIIVLMPWLALINSEKRTESYKKRGLKEVIHLPRRAFNGSRVQTCIMVFVEGNQREVKLNFATGQ